MAKRRWNDLSPATRRLIVVGGALEGALKVAALSDLVRRPSEQVRGPRAAWGLAIIAVNAVGAVPLAYFRYGRTPA